MIRRLLLSLLLAGLALPALAIDYRSVVPAAAILFDAPSQKARKLYLIKAGTPVEVVVRVEGWLKVRDAEGTLAWIEAAQLSERRTVIVTATQAEIRQAEREDAPAVATLGKWVVVDLLDKAAPGWIKVRHADGATGFLRTTQVWGS